MAKMKKGAVDSRVINNILLVAIATFALTAIFTALIYGSVKDEVREPEFVSIMNREEIVVLRVNVFSQLRDSYKDSVIERVYCMFGEKKGKEIIIKDVKEELLIEANETQAKTSSEFSCQLPGVVGTLHFHLPQFYYGSTEVICEPSLTDAYTFGTLAVEGEGHIVQGIQCGADKFAFFDTNIGGNNAFEPKSFNWVIR